LSSRGCGGTLFGSANGDGGVSRDASQFSRALKKKTIATIDATMRRLRATRNTTIGRI
jgi:hypothetical protein